MKKVAFTNEQKENIESALGDCLPHGSGINSSWEFSWQRDGSIVCANSFHCMNDVGYYDGWADFKVVIKPDSEFRLMFVGKTAQYKAARYQLRECIEELVYHALYPHTLLELSSLLN